MQVSLKFCVDFDSFVLVTIFTNESNIYISWNILSERNICLILRNYRIIHKSIKNGLITAIRDTR